jgi:putative spermidine/putrescine transport system ATP-binding protein
MPHLVLQDLRKRFAGNQALDGVSLALEQGELVSLLGPSGCGKTTALRCVAGFLQPDTGTIVVGGDDITRLAPNRRDIGMVFQAYSLFPNMSAAQNVEFGLKVRRKGREDRGKRVAELLEIVGLGDAAGRYPHELSGGMQQRVALARALAIEPRVLLLDEPLSALDALVRVQLREEIRRVQTQLGITTLYVTHDQEEALSVSDRVAVMRNGRIEQIGVPAEIYGAPSTRFVAEFIGTMNRLESTVSTPGSVELGGVRLAVDATASRVAGDAVLLLVRPEALELSPINGHVPEGTLPGSITAQTFLGPVTRVKVAADAGPELVATIPSADAVEFAVGTRVVASFAPASARVLDSAG